ncbi:MAG: EamA family transporter [Alphaproteobacteria bacterium]|nr:EamA family transporter [Alphaproteobacteria bacterium]
MGKLSATEVLMALAVPLVWGMGLVLAKGAIEQFPPILLMGFRFTLTAFLLVWFVPIPRKNLVWLFCTAIVACAVQYSLTFTGLKGLDAGIAALIVQLEVPFLVILGAVLLGEKPEARKWVGIVVAFIGVGLIANPGTFQGDVWAVGLVIGGALSWALGQIMVRRMKDIDGLTVTAWTAVFAAPQLFVMSALFEEGQVQAVQQAKPIVWLAVAYLGIVMTAFGYFLWNTLIRRHDVGRVAPFLLLLPLYASLGGMLFLGERPSLNSLLGGAVILAGVGIITLQRRTKTPDASPSG